MIHVSDPVDEDPNDGLIKLHFFLNYLRGQFQNNYKPEERLAVDEYSSLWKGRSKFCINILSNQERYGVKIFMLSKSGTGYLLNFITYIGATTAKTNFQQIYQSPLKTTKVLQKLCCQFFMATWIRLLCNSWQFLNIHWIGYFSLSKSNRLLRHTTEEEKSSTWLLVVETESRWSAEG